jgi:outer membrane immunogenic protein
MKRLLLASVAAAVIIPGGSVWAADMAVKAPPPPPPAPPAFSWTGFYIGGNVGVGEARAPFSDTFTGFEGNADSSATFIGGGQVGFNYQFSPYWVFGAEWLFDGVSNNNNGNAIFVGPNGNALQATASANWITTATARVGVTTPYLPNWLLYWKGGGGWIQTQGTLTDLTTGGSISNTETRGGWVAGIGMEWAFSQNWTAKIEYQYLGLDNFSVGPGIIGDTIRVHDANISTWTFGINYLFNWGNWGGPPPPPVVSRY